MSIFFRLHFHLTIKKSIRPNAKCCRRNGISETSGRFDLDSDEIIVVSANKHVLKLVQVVDSNALDDFNELLLASRSFARCCTDNASDWYVTVHGHRERRARRSERSSGSGSMISTDRVQQVVSRGANIGSGVS